MTRRWLTRNQIHSQRDRLTRRNNLDGEALEIAGFWDGNEDGVICALRVIHHKSRGFFRIHRGVHQVFHEQLTGRVVGAAEGGKQATSV